MTHRAAFLDLNGTLVMPLKPERLADLAPVPGAFDAVARLSRAGFVCPVITVQSRIAKGTFSQADFLTWFAGFADLAHHYGANLAGPYVCPHRYGQPCSCKKPQRLLYDQAAADLDIALPQSIVIGDSPEDMGAASALGVVGCLVQTGWAADPAVCATVASQVAIVAPSIAEAVDWILCHIMRPNQSSMRPPSNDRCN
jgi:D-glycero-D-manno-heptose 1,7-bisphosphate phosphatase